MGVDLCVYHPAGNYYNFITTLQVCNDALVVYQQHVYKPNENVPYLTIWKGGKFGPAHFFFYCTKCVIGRNASEGNVFQPLTQNIIGVSRNTKHFHKFRHKAGLQQGGKLDNNTFKMIFLINKVPF